jgi:hypothetical protein
MIGGMDHSEHKRDRPSWAKILIPLALGSVCLGIGWDSIGTMKTGAEALAAFILLFLSGYWSYRMIRGK